jgi:cation transport ATPase
MRIPRLYLSIFVVLYSVILSPAATTKNILPQKVQTEQELKKDMPPVEKKKAKKRKGRKKQKFRKKQPSLGGLEVGAAWGIVLSVLLVISSLLFAFSFWFFPLWVLWLGFSLIVATYVIAWLLLFTQFYWDPEASYIGHYLAIVSLVIGLSFLILGLVFGFSFLWIMGIVLLVLAIVMFVYMLIGISYFN